jgi:murein DD-endopeptidase MepM/ murein hydrolase activator NlpD
MGQESKTGWLLKPRTIALGLTIAVAIPAAAFVSGFFAGQGAAVPPSEVDAQVDGFARVLTLASWEAEIEPQPPMPITRVVAVESGDNLMGVLIRAGAERTVAHAAIQSLKGSYDPRRDLNIGDELQITFGPGTIRSVENTEAEAENNPNYVLARLTIPVSYDKLIDVSRNEEGEYNASEVERPLVREVVTASGQIESSLFVADETTAGNLDYFNSKGNSVRKTLMRTPVDGARLSSRFGKRKHPILGYTRMHAGVDFAAPTGTPIYAAGNGTVVQAGRNGGYGNYIRIRHNGTYQTAYAHLSKFARKTRKGARVKQGQVIGYIGTTGRSTGPHLHYEVLRNGRQINPRSVRIPSGEKLKGAELKKFIAMRDARDLEYAQLRDAGMRLVENNTDEQ